MPSFVGRVCFDHIAIERQVETWVERFLKVLGIPGIVQGGGWHWAANEDLREGIHESAHSANCVPQELQGQ